MVNWNHHSDVVVCIKGVNQGGGDFKNVCHKNITNISQKYNLCRISQASKQPLDKKKNKIEDQWKYIKDIARQSPELAGQAKT